MYGGYRAFLLAQMVKNLPAMQETWVWTLGQEDPLEYTEELYKKDLHEPDNHDGVITDLEPDILESKIKWALGSYQYEHSGGDGMPAELFQVLKDDAVKVLHSIRQQIWKTWQWPQDWKMSVFIPIPKKAVPKNDPTTTQLHSSHTLVK